MDYIAVVPVYNLDFSSFILQSRLAYRLEEIYPRHISNAFPICYLR